MLKEGDLVLAEIGGRLCPVRIETGPRLTRGAKAEWTGRNLLTGRRVRGGTKRLTTHVTFVRTKGELVARPTRPRFFGDESLRWRLADLHE